MSFAVCCWLCVCVACFWLFDAGDNCSFEVYCGLLLVVFFSSLRVGCWSLVVDAFSLAVVGCALLIVG